MSVDRTAAFDGKVELAHQRVIETEKAMREAMAQVHEMQRGTLLAKEATPIHTPEAVEWMCLASEIARHTERVMRDHSLALLELVACVEAKASF